MALNTNGSNREQFAGLDTEARRALIDDLVSDNVLVGDPRRWRPRWFDGRFLAASDLLSEQNYFLVRQADIGRAAGSGVVEGLDVSFIDNPGTASDQLRITSGHGVTDTGEIVALLDDLNFNPADIPEMRRLDAAFGLQVIPNQPGQTRTGLYILALRPVEWTAGPIGAYPTSLTGQRTVEDGTIVEGVAVSLVPYPDTGNEETWVLRRARVAREVFVEGRDHGFDSGVLPLAMVALRGNLVEWVDPYMVRRETGAERPAGMDFGFGARALREAHLLQYQRHLADTFNANQDQPFPAPAWFSALPPVGPFPSGTIDADRLTQRFFPPGIDVDVSFIPEDELPAVIEESLMLPPIDLTLRVEELTGTGVVVLVPLPRAQFAANRAALPNWDDPPPELRPGFLQLKANATPRDLLVARVFRPAVAPAAPAEEKPWQAFLRTALASPLLWYVRRRHLPIPSNVAGTPVSADNESDVDASSLVAAIAADAYLTDRVNRLRALDLPEVPALMTRLAAPRILATAPMLRSLIAKASGGASAAPTAATVVSALLACVESSLGNGIRILSRFDAALESRLSENAVAESGLLADIDRLVRDVPAAQHGILTDALRSMVGTSGPPPAELETNLIKLRLDLAPLVP